MSRRKNAGAGYGYMFSGAFAKKADAVKKEKKRKGSFVKAVMMRSGMRYAVMTPRTNPAKRRKQKMSFDEANRYLLHEHAMESANAATPAQRRKIAKKAAAARQIVGRENPGELLVLGANPTGANPSGNQEITVPPGSTVTIRMNPTAQLRDNWMSTERARVISGMHQQEDERFKEHMRSRKRVRFASKEPDFSGKKRHVVMDIVNKVRAKNPVCGAMIGGYPCSRKPGHKGPHLPQGATMRPRTRLRKGWQPNPSAAAIRENFTGSPADFFTVRDEPHIPHGDYAQLGELLALYVKPARGGQVQQIDFKHGRPLLLSDETARQLYFAGGDQDLSPELRLFTEQESSGLVTLGECRRIDYKQRKEHVPAPEIDEWRHEFGEESGVRPMLCFDTGTKRLLLHGGEYVVRREGIVN